MNNALNTSNSFRSRIKPSLGWLSNGLVVALLLLQFINFVSQVSINTKDKTLLQGRDDDSAQGITVAMKTKWWNDNTWYPYGVLYYRLAHTVYHLSPAQLPLNNETDLELKERGHHLAIFVINIFATYFLAFFLIRLFTRNKLHIGLGLILLMPAFITNQVWAKMFIRVHPEILFCTLLMGLLTYLYEIFKDEKDLPSLKKFSVYLGLIASTKMNILLFLPGLLILLGFHWKKSFWQYFKILLKWSLGTYFIIGFPQNFIIHKTLRTMQGMGKFQAPVTLASIQEWFLLIADQIWMPAAILVIIGILFLEKQTFTPNRGRAYTKLLLFVIFSIVLLITRNTILPHEHYVFASVAALLFCLSAGLLFLPQKIIETKNKYFHFFGNELLWGIIFLVSLKFSIGMIPQTLANQIAVSNTCMKEASEVKNMAIGYIKKGIHIIADPYTPVNRDAYKDLVFKEWDNRFEVLYEKKSQALILNSSYYSRYTTESEPSEYVKRDIPKWREAREFYLSLSGKDTFIDPWQGNWKKVYQVCAYEIWEKI